MPCRNENDSSKFPSYPTHSFPPDYFPADSFPADFELDTPHLLQALAEHNYKRVDEGLSTQNYFQLSADGRHEVLDRANQLKFASRVRVVALKLPPPHVVKEQAAKERAAFLLQRERKHFDSVGTYFLLGAGAFILTLIVLRFL